MPYRPAHDAVDDPAVLLDFIARHPLATLVTHDGETPDADLLPLLAQQGGEGVELIGHVARANELWQRPQVGPVLAVFGPVDHYVSPTWYPSKAEHQRVVPTWNYLVVHARGELVVHDDRAWTRAAVARLTNAMESGRSQPWRVGMAPQEYVEEQLHEIVGISIAVTSLVGKFKVSGKRSAADREGAATGIAADGGPEELVTAMRLAWRP
ncbi:FMN-binding negative transcriptional regulator [Nocardioides currus]|uniref:Transcriptional regulator n=1 Tax=Nocardioides currus TaxID=2133958 RepID=A0A2R7YS93_9ACTN|nr:FMN-binding negative transcriptional regulator [Nocardioides currus]PUA79270.1 transcriptional regulator [Nocardioides currus]